MLSRANAYKDGRYKAIPVESRFSEAGNYGETKKIQMLRKILLSYFTHFFLLLGRMAQMNGTEIGIAFDFLSIFNQSGRELIEHLEEVTQVYNR